MVVKRDVFFCQETKAGVKGDDPGATTIEVGAAQNSRMLATVEKEWDVVVVQQVVRFSDVLTDPTLAVDPPHPTVLI